MGMGGGGGREVDFSQATFSLRKTPKHHELNQTKLEHAAGDTPLELCRGGFSGKKVLGVLF